MKTTKTWVKWAVCGAIVACGANLAKAEGEHRVEAGANYMSGAGKTTIARLWRSHGATILNDERNLIRPFENGILAGASPWHGEENQINTATAPLAAIFFLKQSKDNSLRALALEDSLSRILTTTFIPVFLPDGPARTVDSLGAILERVPSYELSFSPDKRALELCRSAIGD